MDRLKSASYTNILLSRLTFHSRALEARIKSVCKIANDPASESVRIIAALNWIGLFSEEKVEIKNGTLLDTLCARLEKLMEYKKGERDLVMLQHKFLVEWMDGKEACLIPTSAAGNADIALHKGYHHAHT